MYKIDKFVVVIVNSAYYTGADISELWQGQCITDFKLCAHLGSNPCYWRVPSIVYKIN